MGRRDLQIHRRLDPTNKDRYFVGNDKGPSLTHDHGASFNFFDNMALAQFCASGVDMRDPYYIYGGTQDNGSWGGPSFACFVSLNGGKSWTPLMNNLPSVAVRDLVIHPRDNDLIAATHGRAIWILDDITPLQQLTDVGFQYPSKTTSPVFDVFSRIPMGTNPSRTLACEVLLPRRSVTWYPGPSRSEFKERSPRC